MDESKYLKYFKRKLKHWSLVDYDSWALNNIEHCQQGFIHRIFYRHTNNILQKSTSKSKVKKARELLNSKK